MLGDTGHLSAMRLLPFPAAGMLGLVRALEDGEVVRPGIRRSALVFVIACLTSV
jgi:hypothetical protein